MISIPRFRKPSYVEPVKLESFDSKDIDKKSEAAAAVNGTYAVASETNRKRSKRQPKEWKCIDYCFWTIGCLFTTWWVLLFLFFTLPGALLSGAQGPESPGTRLKREGLTPNHPVVLVPGFFTGGLEVWEGKPCAENMFRKRVWAGGFTELIKRPLCVLEHLSLDNETGLDPPGIRVRPVPGMVGADYFAPGYIVWATLIENFAKLGYEDKNMYMATYDWRLSFKNTQVRDRALTKLKNQIEYLYETNGNKKVVVVPHSMGVLYFLHFIKWVEAPPPMGGGGGSGWCAKYIKTIANVGPVFLGTIKAIGKTVSAEYRDSSTVRAMAPGLIDSGKTFEHALRVCRTWDSIASLMPKGGETVWGNLDWSPEQGDVSDLSMKISSQSIGNDKNINATDVKRGFHAKDPPKHGRILAFGKDASRIPSSELSSLDVKEILSTNTNKDLNSSCEEVLTEYDTLSWETIQKVTENKAYTAETVFDFLRVIAPKMMRRFEAEFSFGIADDLDHPKYSHYKYWSNPLETKLPDAPDMEIYCIYGFGIPSERSYVYKVSPSGKCTTNPLRIDTSVNEDDDNLKGGIYLADGDVSVNLLSSGYMCAKGWKGKTRFNPSGSPTYVREYRDKSPTGMFEVRGPENSGHVDILANLGAIEDLLRIAAGATPDELGGDKIQSDLMTLANRVNLQL